jgi:hypothetical protein
MRFTPVLEGSFDFDRGMEKTALIIYLAECLRKVDAGDVRIFEGRADTRSADWSIFFPALAWLWLVGGNLTIGLPRFKSFLREAIDSTPV